MIKQPRLLDGNLQEIARLHPSMLSATLCLTPLSVASMSLPEGEPTVGVRQFVELYGDSGSLGIYRVGQVGTNYGTEQRISLEHGITTLEDEVTAAETELSGSMQNIMQAIVDSQINKRWKLGDVEAPGNDYALAVNRTSALQALLDAANLVDGYYLDFDQTTAPWTVHLRKLTDEVSSECRITRNIEGITITLDDSSLCTRVYSELLPNGYMDADTVSTWGIVAEGISLETPVEGEEEATAAKNKETAKKHLDANKNPTVSIDVNALMLSSLTGEALDKFVVGKVCRVALPDWGVTMNERIISMTYTDMVNAPEQVRLTLSTEEKNASTALTSLSSQVRQTTRVVKEQHKHITETDTELKLHADKITANANEILLRATTADVSALGERVYNAEIAIDGYNAAIELKVSKDEVVSAINMSPESIKISSNHIDLQGYVTATELEAELARFDAVFAGTSAVDAFVVGALRCTSHLVTAGALSVNGNFNVDGSSAGWKETEVVKSLSGLSVTTATIPYVDHSGTNRYFSVVTAVSQNSPSMATLSYLGK